MSTVTITIVDQPEDGTVSLVVDFGGEVARDDSPAHRMAVDMVSQVTDFSDAKYSTHGAGHG